MEQFNVLVVCTRKKGKCNDRQGGLVEDIVIPKIEQYISNNFSSSFNIEYLAKLDKNFQQGDEVDFNLDFDRNSMVFNNFRKAHLNYYDIIILNTCPFRLIDYSDIRSLLKNDGKLILSKVTCLKEYTEEDFRLPPQFFIAAGTGNLLEYFDYDNEYQCYVKKFYNNAKRIFEEVLTQYGETRYISWFQYFFNYFRILKSTSDDKIRENATIFLETLIAQDNQIGGKKKKEKNVPKKKHLKKKETKKNKKKQNTF